MKRLEVDTSFGEYVGMEESPDGEFVRYQEVEPLIRALEKIANEDFRGNRPESVVLAFKALKAAGLK